MSDSNPTKSTVNPVDMLWQKMSLNNGDAVWYCTIGIILQAMIISSILGKTVEYFDYFKKRDNPYFLYGIALGNLIAFGSLGITCAENYVLVHQKSLNTASAIRFIILGDITNLFLGTLFNSSACIYYSWRVYKMSGSRKWIIPIFVLFLTAQFVAAMVAAGDGYTCPHITPETLKDLQTFMKRNVKEFEIWGAVTTAVDGSLCLSMTILLFKSRDGVFHRETRIFNKLISIIYETMLPPVICLLVNLTSTRVGDNPLSDFNKIITCILPVLYFHSLLHTLVGRKRIREILDEKLLKEGVNLISDGRDNYKGSNSGKFNFTVTSSENSISKSTGITSGGGRVIDQAEFRGYHNDGEIPLTSQKSFIWDGRQL
ncbi:uncharacterized protein I206_104972 [Kwoniella pini CBS 10737]|uniref:DUF6534 domain-containing protein n=1 Tax=Kwoniella pini CBS 10737 TaxID=1296096 RepID=A0A1B9I8H4_9TREE|nr:uncharacterized protein I206_02511 [Kwoniella pini CBS 10737]OCF51795.1 hypothetical protein I206_02511 [Kwoniella pini CBS 10737]